MVLVFNRFNLFGGRLDVYSGPISAGVLLFSIGNNLAIPTPFFTSLTSLTVAYTTSVANRTTTGLGFGLTYYGTYIH
jgi:hypothetical protein